MNHQTQKSARGYYTVNIENGGKLLPYVVLAASDYHAACLVRYETGVMARESDIHGPYAQL